MAAPEMMNVHDALGLCGRQLGELIGRPLDDEHKLGAYRTVFAATVESLANFGLSRPIAENIVCLIVAVVAGARSSLLEPGTYQHSTAAPARATAKRGA